VRPADLEDKLRRIKEQCSKPGCTKAERALFYVIDELECDAARLGISPSHSDATMRILTSIASSWDHITEMEFHGIELLPPTPTRKSPI
jgi:hypothetical protein